MADRRPDLEALPFKNPGFIADFLMPIVPVNVKAANPVYYSDILADATVQTARSLTSAPAATTYASATTSFSCAERISRIQAGESEVALLGGLEAAQAKMARRGKRGIGSFIESNCAAATFGAITPVDILGSFLAKFDVAKETVMDYASGRLALFGSTRIINRLKRYNEVVERMSFTGVPIGNLRDVRSISDDMLAAALGVDVVLAGPSAEWLATSTYDGYLGVMVLPDAAMDPDEEVQFGRRYVYIGDGLTEGNPYRVETFRSDDLRTQVCDVSVWSNAVTFNPETCYVLKGIDEENTVVTTAS